MANLGSKNGIFHIRFRFDGIEYKKSVKTRDADVAAIALNTAERTIGLLGMGEKQIPEGVDPGDFIVSGGTAVKRRAKTRVDQIPTLSEAVSEYLVHQKGRIADTYLASQGTHLKHLKGFLDEGDIVCNAITFVQLDRFLSKRLKTKDASTVTKERITLRRFFGWCDDREYVGPSPATELQPIPHGREMDRFRTKEEIEGILDRGGATKEDTRELWECLYVTTAEIGGLLDLVRKNTKHDTSHLLHAIPAYTGMRRGEVLRLRWSHIDFKRRVVTALSRKQARDKEWTQRDIELHDDLRRILLAWRKKRPNGQFVLCRAESLKPLTIDEANRHFWHPMRGTEWCLDSKKNWFKVTFHTYRHSFASNLASLGVDERIIDNFMGHQTEAMRRRYRHLYPKDRRNAIDRLSYTTGDT